MRRCKEPVLAEALELAELEEIGWIIRRSFYWKNNGWRRK
jgi:hypothetical protein